MKHTHNSFEELVRQKQIVQHYSLQPTTPQKYPRLYQIEPPIFYEDFIFQELEKTAIVEDYDPDLKLIQEDNRMEVEDEGIHIQEEEPYEELFPQQRSRLQFDSTKMLDSASSGRQLPSRNSSVSSISSQSQKQYSTPLNLRPQVTTLEHFITPDEPRGRGRREAGSSTEKRERLTKIKKLQEIGCNCKKSKCLKMYCECFNLQILCGQNCNCCDCGNMSENDHHQKAVLNALTRNPKAFAQDAQVMETVFQLGVQLSLVKKGCRCRKTQCKKKYCECFNSGQACGIFCQCEGCSNTRSPR